MAVPLRNVRSNAQPAPRQPERRQARPAATAASSPRRLVRRQIQSNASHRKTVTLVFFAILGVLLAMGFSHALVKAEISKLNYSIHSLRNENELIVLENEKIRGQIAELRSLDRIEEIASRELGMVKNVNVEYMLLSSTIVSEGKIKPIEEEEAIASTEGFLFLEELKAWIDALWKS